MTHYNISRSFRWRGCRLNRPTGHIHNKKSQKRTSDVREMGNNQGW